MLPRPLTQLKWVGSECDSYHRKKNSEAKENPLWMASLEFHTLARVWNSRLFLMKLDL